MAIGRLIQESYEKDYDRIEDIQDSIPTGKLVDLIAVPANTLDDISLCQYVS